MPHMVGNTHFQVKRGTRNWETLTFQVKREGILRLLILTLLLGDLGIYPSNFCKGVICCIHHSHSGHEVGCTTAWQLECLHVDCSHWKSPCLPSTNL